MKLLVVIIIFLLYTFLFKKAVGILNLNIKSFAHYLILVFAL